MDKEKMDKEEIGKAMLESERSKACWKELPLNVREEYLARHPGKHHRTSPS